MLHWFLLTLAIVLEVAGTTAMKLSEGFTHLVPSVLLFVFYAASFIALTFAIRRIDISVAYAVWSGLGMAIVAVIGFAFFKETVTITKIACICLIMAGVVGLNMSASS